MMPRDSIAGMPNETVQFRGRPEAVVMCAGTWRVVFAVPVDVKTALLAEVANAAGAANGIGGDRCNIVEKFSTGQVHIGVRIDGDGNVGCAVFSQDGSSGAQSFPRSKCRLHVLHTALWRVGKVRERC